MRCTDPYGNPFKSEKAMCKHYNIPYKEYLKRKYKGMSIEAALLTPLEDTVKQVFDHKGISYKSLVRKCQAYGIPTHVYQKRIRDGWSEEKALTTPPKEYTPQECTDFEGNVFPSRKAMCELYGIDDPRKYVNRIKLGWSQKRALLTPIKPKNNKRKPYTDFEGRIFKTQREMCEYHHISYKMYSQRIHYGWSLEDALTRPSSRLSS